jgi:hypothetical protein
MTKLSENMSEADKIIANKSKAIPVTGREGP